MGMPSTWFTADVRARKGDVVYVGRGGVHWTVIDEGDVMCVLKSQMTGRVRSALTKDLRHWSPQND